MCVCVCVWVGGWGTVNSVLDKLATYQLATG